MIIRLKRHEKLEIIGLYYAWFIVKYIGLLTYAIQYLRSLCLGTKVNRVNKSISKTPIRIQESFWIIPLRTFIHTT